MADLTEPRSQATRATLQNLILSALVATILVIAGAATLLVYGGRSINAVTAQRETALLARGLERATQRIYEDVTSATIWNETYDRTKGAFDTNWSHQNFGVYYSQYLHHDLTVVLSPRGELMYFADHGVMTPVAQAATLRAALEPLIRLARTEEARKIAVDAAAKSFARSGSAKGALAWNDRFFLAVASTVAPEPNYRGAVSGQGALVVSLVEMDEAFLADLGQTYDIARPSLSPTAPANAASTPLRGPDGKTVHYLAWAPRQPASTFFDHARPAILGASALIILALAVLFIHIAQMARRLVHAKEAAIAADQAKSAFLANMSHEIRTPLNGVLGMAQVMERHELPPAQRHRLQIIREAGRTLLVILNDLLDLSKAEAGKLELECAPFNVDALADAVCSTFEASAASRDLKLSVCVADTAQGWRSGDALRLRQVLSNLVSNAIKFTHAGTVSLSIDGDAESLTFHVEDTGIGLEPSQIPALFQKFSQADATTTRRYGGTGLGLAICQEIVALMEGRIIVTSAVGEGSRFSFTVPMARAQQPPSEPARTVEDLRPGEGLRILAAEDNPTNQLVLRSLLEPIQAELVFAGTGIEAVEAFKLATFDIILMDIQMPEMNGVEACREIRAIEATLGQARTPMLCLSANVMTHQVEQYLAAGMDGSVAKPVELDKLYAEIERVMAVRDLDIDPADARSA